MRTAWKAIPTLSRTCAHCCRELSVAHAPLCRRYITKTGRTEILDRRGRGTLLFQVAHRERGSIDTRCAVGSEGGEGQASFSKACDYTVLSRGDLLRFRRPPHHRGPDVRQCRSL